MKHLKLYEAFKDTSDKNIELSTNLLKIAEVGMYNTRLDPDSLLNIEENELSDEEYEKYQNNFNLDKYKKWIMSSIKDYVMIELDLLDTLKSINPHIKDVTFEKIWSPKEYNYGNDELDFDLVVENGFDKYILDDIVEMDYYDSPHKSQPGFSSFMPQNIEDLKAGIENDAGEYERCVAAWIEDKLKYSDYNFEIDEFVEYIMTNNYQHPLDFITE